jgi:3-hydroxyisobutyrate dehydrogenase-like beta-hydroxyacid dehydrogenase
MAAGLKDVRLMLSAAAEAGTKLDMGELVERNLSVGVDAGMGEQDWSSIHALARKKAGLD